MLLEVGTNSAFSNPFETREALMGLYYRGVAPKRERKEGLEEAPPTEEQMERRVDVAQEMAAKMKALRRQAAAAQPPPDPPVE